jgi:hypothetical protein
MDDTRKRSRVTASLTGQSCPFNTPMKTRTISTRHHISPQVRWAPVLIQLWRDSECCEYGSNTDPQRRSRHESSGACATSETERSIWTFRHGAEEPLRFELIRFREHSIIMKHGPARLEQPNAMLGTVLRTRHSREPWTLQARSNLHRCHQK